MTPRDEAIEAVARLFFDFGTTLLSEYGISPELPRNDPEYGEACRETAIQFVELITPLLTRAALDAADARLRDAVNDFSFLRDVIRKNRIASPPPHRLQISDGSWHEGPVVDFLHDILGEMELYLDAALRAGKGVE